MPDARAPRDAVISVGTNSCRLLIASRSAGDAPRPEYHETRGTRLGEGVDERRRLEPAAVERTLAAVRDYALLAAGCRMFGIGTSALRDAGDAKPFLREFERAAGVPLRVLSGDEEARCSFAGALAGVAAAGRAVPEEVTVIDVGGGSTEFATRSRSAREPAVASLQIGAVRLTEQHLRSDPPSSDDIERCRLAIRSELGGLPSPVDPKATVIGVGGTANTAARMLQLLENGNGVAEIPSTDLTALLRATIALSVSERKRMRGLPAQRADIFPGGLMILDEVVKRAGANALIVSESDLLLGYIARHG